MSKVKIADLTPGMKSIELFAKINDIRTPRQAKGFMITDVILEDIDGNTIKIALFGTEADGFAINDEIHLQNGYTTEYNGNVQLNKGKYGTLSRKGGLSPPKPTKKASSTLTSLKLCFNEISSQVEILSGLIDKLEGE